MPKWVVAAGAVALLAVLVVAAVVASRIESEPEAGEPTVAASSARPTAPSLPPTPTPEPTPEIELWAGEVCEARDGFVNAVVDVAANLEYDPNDPASIGEQFQQQLPGQLDGVDAASQRLGEALGTIPVDYIEAAAAVSMLQDRLEILQTAKDEALSHVDAAQGAGNPVEAGVEWLRAAAAAKATYDAGVQVKDALGPLADSAEGDVRDAFATAPRCSSWDIAVP
jgi:hypothetical protein